MTPWSERTAHGRGLRSTHPRSGHAEWQRGTTTDPVAVLEQQAVSRVPELVPIRYGRMLVSPFTFYRGAAALMAADLAESPSTGLRTQLCGDAHLSNFGAFAAPDRRLVFSLNDFDETLPGPFEWDVKRMVTSFAVAGRDRGFDDETRGTVNRAATRAYREAIREMARMRTLDLWYARLDVDDIRAQMTALAKPREVKRFEKNVAKARAKDSVKAFDKMVQVVDGQMRLIGDPPLVVPLEDLLPDREHQEIDTEMRELVRAYGRTLPGDRRHLLEGFRYVGAARKVVGVGSVGTRAWIVLMMGRDDQDPLFLQAKEAEASVLEPYLGRSRFANHGRRVVEGQWLMQSTSDILLGWIRTTGNDGASRDFYVRQLWDGKGSAVVEAMEPSTMTAYAGLCGWTLARAHARSGDAAAIAGYLGSGETFDRAIAQFAESYADQNERDYAALRAAVDSGQLTAEAGL